MLANPTGKGLKPFKKGQSGNPGGKSKADVSLEERRKINARAILEAIDPAERDDAISRWWFRFKAGNRDALWLVPYVFAAPPKAAEPEQSTADRVNTLEIRRLDKDGDGADSDPAAPV